MITFNKAGDSAFVDVRQGEGWEKTYVRTGLSDGIHRGAGRHRGGHGAEGRQRRWKAREEDRRVGGMMGNVEMDEWGM